MTAGQGTAQFGLAAKKIVAIIIRHNTFAIGWLTFGAALWAILG